MASNSIRRRNGPTPIRIRSKAIARECFWQACWWRGCTPTKSSSRTAASTARSSRKPSPSNWASLAGRRPAPHLFRGCYGCGTLLRDRCTALGCAPGTLRQQLLDQGAKVRLILQRLRRHVRSGLLADLALAVDDGDLRETRAVHYGQPQEDVQRIAQQGSDGERLRILVVIVLGHLGRGLIDRRADGLESLRSVFGLELVQQLREPLAMRAGGKQELHHYDLTLVIRQRDALAGRIDEAQRRSGTRNRRRGKKHSAQGEDCGGKKKRSHMFIPQLYDSTS